MKGSYEVVERSEQEIGGNEDLLTIIDIDRCILNSQYFSNWSQLHFVRLV